MFGGSFLINESGGRQLPLEKSVVNCACLSTCLKLIMMQIRKSGHTCHGLRLPVWLFGDKDHAFASDSEPQRLKIQGHKNIKHRR